MLANFGRQAKAFEPAIHEGSVFLPTLEKISRLLGSGPFALSKMGSKGLFKTDALPGSIAFPVSCFQFRRTRHETTGTKLKTQLCDLGMSEATYKLQRQLVLAFFAFAKKANAERHDLAGHAISA